MATQYSYTALASDIEYIRLLNLLPANNESDDLIISLEEVRFDDTAPPYEALSYTWGTRKDRPSIKVASSNTAADYDGLLVTKNLFVALKHLRRPDLPRTLWVDAISIDQTNPVERSYQVAIMARIFEQASRVVVWLGPEEEDSDLGLAKLEDLGRKVDVNWLSREIRPSTAWAHEGHWADLTSYLPYATSEVLAIAGIINRPWFGRLWVVQEIRVANPTAIVLCGRKEVSWNLIEAAIYVLFRKRMGAGDSQAIRPYLLVINNSFFKWFESTIRDVLFQTQELACREPRDKVYGILGIVSDQLGIKPDYTLPTDEVYKDVVQRYISHYNSLDILRDCDVSRRGSQTNTPTWIPDWTNKRATGPMRFTQASGLTQCNVSYPEPGILRISAVHCATITTVQDIRKFDLQPNVVSPEELEDIIDEILRLLPADLSAKDAAGCSVLEAISGSLLCSTFPTLDPRRPSRPPRKAAMAAVNSIGKGRNTIDGNEVILPAVTHFMQSFLPHSQGRSLVKTEEGFIGLAPWGTKEDDIICAPLGCDALLTLRPDWHGEKFEVIGETFLYGLMQGEAVLGRFADDVEGIYQRHETVGYRPAYRNKATGDTSWTDSRFANLGISVTLDEESGFPVAVKMEELMAAGVTVVEYDLI